MTDTARISMLSATSPTRAPTSAKASTEETRSRDDVSSASSESAFEAQLSRAQREDRQQDRQAMQTQAQEAQQQRVERREAAEDKHAQHLEQAQAASSDTSPTQGPAGAALQSGNLPPAQPSSASQTAGQPSAQSLEVSRLDSSVERGISRMQQLQQLAQGGQGTSGSDEAVLNATTATTAGNTAVNTAGDTALQGDWLAALRNPAAAGLDGAIADHAPTSRTSPAAAGSLSADAPSSLMDGALGPLTEEAVEGVTAKADGALLDANGSRAGGDPSQLSGASSAGVSVGAPSSAAAGSGTMLNGSGIPAANPAGMASQAGALIPASVGTQAWQQALSEQVVRMQLSKSPQAEIALNPANLGKLTIRLNIGEQGTSAHFVAGHQQVRSAVESSLGELRQALESRGHELTAISFSSQDDMQQDDARDEAPGNSPNQGQFAQHLEGQPASGASKSADAMEGSLAASNLTGELTSASQLAWGRREWQA
ncbi:flagellar hook-length control protein FliK [Cobetia sp. LC6]|uniref:flagellar hook-length control protein FliK n=1 Tax=Cobetia sp. LC6 TaxID=3050947 RepID=UPI002556CEFC|nr:flagellar hook-length control protein FliK [Cobetia sp. LC6]MDL2191110.1 flagellar hook-length control protein FliK [Cobetia sp. LC6]